jgi:release factor glutamine methyltransferase
VHRLCGLLLEAPEGVYAPRSDTALLAAQLVRRPLAGATVLDLCTGTGALAIVAARAGATVTAVDRCDAALDAARRNAERAGVSLELLHGDVFRPVAGRRFDLICGNPPYLPAPADASPLWDAGADGRAVIERICRGAARHLEPGGSLLIVLSDLTGVEQTIAGMARHGVTAYPTAVHVGPLGPVARGREAHLRARGVWPVDGLERLVVVAGTRSASARAPRVEEAGAAA